MKSSASNDWCRSLRVLAVLSGAAMLSGCCSTHLAFRDLNRDIPPELVQQYREAQNADVDTKESFFLPLLSSSKAHLTRTDSGFEAYRKEDTILGLLTSSKEDARYNETGTLLEYKFDGSVITGLLSAEKSSRTREDNGYRHANKWSTLWGLIHFKDESVKPSPAEATESK